MVRKTEEARSRLKYLDAQIRTVRQQQASLLAECKLKAEQADVTRTPEHIAAQEKARELTLLLKAREAIREQSQAQFLLRKEHIELLERHLRAERAETVKLSAALATVKAINNHPKQGTAAGGKAKMRRAVAG